MNEPSQAKPKYVGLAYDPEFYKLYALREDGAVYEVGESDRRLYVQLPTEES